MNRTYPVFLNLAEKRCLVVGGGKVAERKVRALLRSRADITVLSPELGTGLRRLAGAGKIRHRPRGYRRGGLKGFYLVIAATDSEEANRRIADEAGSNDILVNIVDRPDLCGFLVPSVVERGDLKIAISTNGKSPALAKKMRKTLEKKFGREYADFLKLLGAARRRLKGLYPNDEEKRRRILERLVHSSILQDIKKGKKFRVKDLDRWIS